MNRSKQQLERRSRGRPSQRCYPAAIVTLLLAASAAVSQADSGAPPVIARSAGGISPNPVITSANRTTNKLTVSWQSLARQGATNNVGYTLLKCPELKTNATWKAVGTVTNDTSITTDITADNGFLTVQQDTALGYEGAQVCGLCHVDTHDGWLSTLHASAFDTLKAIKMDKNASCIPCHTVGFGTPKGFVDEATTPHLVGVQCENCHGPASGHVKRLLKPNNEVDETRLPLRTKAAEMCGGCHTDAHHPTYEEWSSSVHGTTTIPAEEFADPTNGPPRKLTCGACHSAATRLALLQGVEDMQVNGITDASKFNPTLPSTQEASTTPITCVTCHDPHEKSAVAPAQLRFPLASKVPYSYSTATNFAANYNPKVQTCAQCHNMRGASWQSSSRPPHHSPQYNILIGNGGFEAGSTNVPQSYHMDIETQCAQCHTHPRTPEQITETTPNYLGHEFTPSFQACSPCHDEVGATIITEAVQDNTKQQVKEIKGLLDQWALTKAPADLTAKYGVLAWEYTNIGQLSTPTSKNPTGPTSAEQAKIPDPIKKARYNLYLIDNDHSYGVHNGNYTRFLLQVARDQVNSTLP